MEQTKTILEKLNAGVYDERLEKLYVDPARIPGQRKRYRRAVLRFEELFGPGLAEVYSVPGRSEVGGNHTDHQHGIVLAASVNLDAIAVVRRIEEPVIRILSEGYDLVTVELSDLEKRAEEEGSTAALIRGMAGRFSNHGYGAVGGFCAYVTSDVLIGAGLSSSAAFEVLVGTIISGLFYEGRIDPVEIARAAQYAENVYFGKPSGLMDQMACSVGGLIRIDFQNPEEPVVTQIPVAFASYQYSLCIVDTKGSHADLTPDYSAIPAEMKAAAACFGKQVLREVDEAQFMKEIPRVRKACGDRAVLRAIHFFSENRRADAEARALADGKFSEFLRLVKESGASSFQYLQNVYTCKHIKEQRVSVALAVSEQVLGEAGVCRVHGGGFAGTIQAFVKQEAVESYRTALDGVFGEGACQVLQVRPVGGIKVL